MKCNELMVGDWIADKHGFPMQVVAFGKANPVSCL